MSAMLSKNLPESCGSSAASVIGGIALANTPLQVISDHLALCLWWRHTIDEAPNVVCKTVVPVFGEQAANGAPTVLYLAPGFQECALAGFDPNVSLQNVRGDCFGLSTEMSRVTALAGTVDRVLLGFSKLAADRAFGCICGDALVAQLAGEFAAPFA